MTHAAHWSQVRGRRMHARVVAPRADVATAGPTIVLVHGLAVSSAYYVPLLERLGTTHRTWAPDLPGHGRTPAAAGGPLDFEELVASLEAWLDANAIADAVLVGNSLGGQLVVALAARRPDLARQLVLLGPTTERRARSIVRHALRLVADVSREPLGLVALETGEYLRCGPRRTVLEYVGGRDHDMLRALGSVRQPVLLLRGGRDPIATERWLDELHRAAPRSARATVAPAAHAAHWSHPKAVAELVRAAACG